MNATSSTSLLSLDLSVPSPTASLFTRPIARSMILLALVVVGLNLLDAFCTLRHVELGAEEVNPLMRHLLDLGPLAFVLGKHVLAAGGVLGIVAHSRHRAARRMLRWVLLPIYLTVAGYQLFLFSVM